MSKKNKILQIVLGILLAFSLSTLPACGVRQLASGRVLPPEISLQEMVIYPPESQCWPLSARLRVTNPNPDPLRVLGYDFQLAMEGADLVQGQSEAAVTLPAGGETLVEVPLLVRLPAIPATLAALLTKDAVSYQFSGGLRLASLLGGLRVPFRFQGTLTRAQGWEYLRQYLGPQPLTR
ncbi:MAG: LEA type 2 family protein [Desulfobacca sp.]|uniref:LEA type 2 family protein n=1 Tax=Desulfobacca sp. TaxID=2067990 RepID=UPI00404995BC